MDSSVWVHHFRRGNVRLAALLGSGSVHCHPFVIGELACGNLRDRTQVLGLLQALPRTPEASHDEALALLESRRLMGRGLGWVDIHLLASAKLARTELWTLDRPLAEAARALGAAPPE